MSLFGLEKLRKVRETALVCFSFNGKENDNEVAGAGNWQDYGMRLYSPRLGRFPSVDPITREYPELTPFQFASNSPIKFIDIDGLEAGEPGYHSFKAMLRNSLQKTESENMKGFGPPLVETAGNYTINTFSTILFLSSGLFTATVGGFYNGATNNTLPSMQYKLNIKDGFVNIPNLESDENLKEIAKATFSVEMSSLLVKGKVFTSENKLLNHIQSFIKDEFLEKTGNKALPTGENRLPEMNFNRNNSKKYLNSSNCAGEINETVIPSSNVNSSRKEKKVSTVTQNIPPSGDR